MASNSFSYSPLTSSTAAQVSITATTVNGTRADKTATISLYNDNAKGTINIVQRYRPYFSVGSDFSNPIPATGGSKTITAHTEYDLVFSGVPSWITIMYNGGQVTEGQRIASGSANNAVFTLTAPANTGEQRTTTNTFSMNHYVGNVNTYAQYINLTQNGDDAPTGYTYIPITVEFVDFYGSEPSLYVVLTSYDNYTTNSTYDLQGGGDAELRAKYLRNGTTQLTIQATYYNSDEPSNSKDLEIAYGDVGDVEEVMPGDTSTQTFTYNSTKSFTITIRPHEEEESE